ncbi:MAG: cysteine hydrolase family protein [Nanoarchaeota archaeon]
MKTIFWNVDTQYDFMREDGKLPVVNAKTIEANLAKLTFIAMDEGVQVVNTGDWHTKDSKEFSDKPNFINTFPPHCVQNTKGAEFVLATKPENPYVIDWQQARIDKKKIESTRNIVIYKDAFDVFAGNSYTDRILEIIKPDRAIVYGVATNVCVDFAVRGLLERKIEVYVPTNAIKELPNLSLQEVLDRWVAKGAKLINTCESRWYI